MYFGAFEINVCRQYWEFPSFFLDTNSYGIILQVFCVKLWYCYLSADVFFQRYFVCGEK